jgi:hypothetical protein
MQQAADCLRRFRLRVRYHHKQDDRAKRCNTASCGYPENRSIRASCRFPTLSHPDRAAAGDLRHHRDLHLARTGSNLPGAPICEVFVTWYVVAGTATQAAF